MKVLQILYTDTNDEDKDLRKTLVVETKAKEQHKQYKKSKDKLLNLLQELKNDS